LTFDNGYKRLFDRYSKNPILSAKCWPYPVHSVFNPGATRLKDGSTLLLCRCEDRRGFSHITAARSEDGFTNWRVDEKPTFAADPVNFPEELYGVEDPRITYMPDMDRFVVAYTAFSKAGPGVALAITEDFRSFDRIGLIMQPDDKDAALFPFLFDGQYAMIHRPTSEQGSHMWISYSPDLTNWGSHKLMLPARRGAWWDANKIGMSPPPILTDRGWIVMYHGVRQHASGSIYRLGLALFDLNHPEVCLLRGQCWMMEPLESYETHGDVPYVVFPCGYTIADDHDTVNLYYGAADSCIGVATGSIKEMLEWLDQNATDMVGVAGSEIERTYLSTTV
jgi:predicted GH43/DUF377 family glycosyl hydrolase